MLLLQIAALSKCTKHKWHIVYAIYVPNVTGKVAGCLPLAYVEYCRPNKGYCLCTKSSNPTCVWKTLVYLLGERGWHVTRLVPCGVYTSCNEMVWFVVSPKSFCHTHAVDWFMIYCKLGFVKLGSFITSYCMSMFYIVIYAANKVHVNKVFFHREIHCNVWRLSYIIYIVPSWFKLKRQLDAHGNFLCLYFYREIMFNSIDEKNIQRPKMSQLWSRQNHRHRSIWVWIALHIKCLWSSSSPRSLHNEQQCCRIAVSHKLVTKNGLEL